ncbi:phosphotransferase system HPr-like phosphotransfer protein [Laceyella sacchari]|jgi:phosphotransferase system HPr-like phosphotransfer protein|uniref:HPr family phosphocarrier protein n=1 Tax=Laceyella sacchari TaxID=37482 RepID=UPI0010EC0F39|nr:HPr family phosphocarrier protein [Laceyella sacchari]TCW37768.1 phosphotransferase system HPr-like phosphotransfer protein [Laceyella sacchari]
MTEYVTACQIPSKISLLEVIRFVEKADQYDCYIVIEANQISINAKSLLSMCVLVSGIIKGPVTIRTSGVDAKKALVAMKRLFSLPRGSEQIGAAAGVDLPRTEISAKRFSASSDQ